MCRFTCSTRFQTFLWNTQHLGEYVNVITLHFMFMMEKYLDLSGIEKGIRYSDKSERSRILDSFLT